jgi:hypothetical protein
MSGCVSPLSFSALSFNTGVAQPPSNANASQEMTRVGSPRIRTLIAIRRRRMLKGSARRRNA